MKKCKICTQRRNVCIDWARRHKSCAKSRSSICVMRKYCQFIRFFVLYVLCPGWEKYQRWDHLDQKFPATRCQTRHTLPHHWTVQAAQDPLKVTTEEVKTGPLNGLLNYDSMGRDFMVFFRLLIQVWA